MNYSSKSRLIVFGVLVAGLNLTTLSSAVALENATNTFSSCSSYNYVNNGASHRTYRMDLSTGDYVEAISQHNHIVTNSPVKLEALGFSVNDSLVCGWNHNNKQPVKVYTDSTVEPLAPHITNNFNLNFNVYAGDVSSKDNRYYVYRRGSNHGVYHIELNSNVDNYGSLIHVPGSEHLNLNKSDLAFDPNDGFAYAVDRKGDAHQIDTAKGSSVHLGHTGLSEFLWCRLGAQGCKPRVDDQNNSSTASFWS